MICNELFQVKEFKTKEVCFSLTSWVKKNWMPGYQPSRLTNIYTCRKYLVYLQKHYVLIDSTLHVPGNNLQPPFLPKEYHLQIKYINNRNIWNHFVLICCPVPGSFLTLLGGVFSFPKGLAVIIGCLLVERSA